MLTSSLTPLLLMAALQQTPATIMQKSSGWCSPNIANVTGNVTVNCIGVDPRALRRLNAQLNRKSLQLTDKIREADEWAAKYKELEARLNEAGDDKVLSRKAEEYLHQGELEKAGTILDKIIYKEDAQAHQTAANHYNRGLVFQLQFLPQEALPHLKKAYQLAIANESLPEQAKYGLDYGGALLSENDFTQAEPVMLATLDAVRQLAKEDPARYQPSVAATLINLGLLYAGIRRIKNAEADDREALDIYRQLAKSNPTQYQPSVALTLNNISSVYSLDRRMKDAEEANQEALDIYRQLAKANPPVYQRWVASTLSNLGDLYIVTSRLNEAKAPLQEALDISRQLTKSNPAYLMSVAETLNNLGRLSFTALSSASDTETAIKRMNEAEVAYQESLDIYRQLANADPAAYQGSVAGVLSNLALLYEATKRIEGAEAADKEALAIRRQLMNENPTVYESSVAWTLTHLGSLYYASKKMNEAETAYQGALDIYRQLTRENFTVYQSNLAISLCNLGNLYGATQRTPAAEKAFEEALNIRRQLAKTNPPLTSRTYPIR